MTANPADRDPELLDVWLVDFPLALFVQAQEHIDGLLREFALISHDRAGESAHGLPARLLAIVDELGAQFAGVSSAPETERDAAIERGDQTVTLHYRVPPAGSAASQHLLGILDEADAYCRSGVHLLSLATPPEALAFRRWFLGQFIQQIAGAAPVPWSAETTAAS